MHSPLMWIWVGAALAAWLTYLFYKAAAEARDTGEDLAGVGQRPAQRRFLDTNCRIA